MLFFLFVFNVNVVDLCGVVFVFVGAVFVSLGLCLSVFFTCFCILFGVWGLCFTFPMFAT